MLSISRYIIDQGVIPPFCELLTIPDTKTIRIALEGLENILKLGAREREKMNDPNQYAVIIEECLGL